MVASVVANSGPILRCQPEIGNDNDDLFGSTIWMKMVRS